MYFLYRTYWSLRGLRYCFSCTIIYVSITQYVIISFVPVTVSKLATTIVLVMVRLSAFCYGRSQKGVEKRGLTLV